MKVVIVGGVAGGANVATRLRRLSESVEIVMVERGKDISFANCGMPYHIGGEIENRAKLLVQTPKSFMQRFNVDVRIRTEAIEIDRTNKRVLIRDLELNSQTWESYDYLVLATGAFPIRPPLPGIDLPGIFSLRDLRDMDNIMEWLSTHQADHAVVIGAGFIGLEMAEQLHQRRCKVTILEALPHILPPFDQEIVTLLEDETRRHGIRLLLGDAVSGFAQNSESSNSGLVVKSAKGEEIHCGMAILSIGVRPDTQLAAKCDLKLGARGAIMVDSSLRTSDSSIFAVGDCVQLNHRVSNQEVMVPLAGPANRLGRLIADTIMGRGRPYKGPLGTAIVRFFDLVAAATGLNEMQLRSSGIEYAAIHLHPNSHASYYPGAKPIAIKILYSPTDDRILGAQAVGHEGVDKRIDVIATAIAGGLTIEDLVDIDLCYAPPFGSAKDPVNLAGMIASNVRDGLVETISWNELAAAKDQFTIIDVRSAEERQQGYIPDSIHIPLDELRQRIGEIPTDKPVVAYCQSGQRSYNSCRILLQHGIKCRNLSGAYRTWKAALQEVRQ